VIDQPPVSESPVLESPAYSAERRQVALHRINRRGVRWRQVRDWAQSFVIAVVLVVLIRSFLIENFRIPSGSMERTLLIGDFLLVNKLAYGAEVPFTGRHLPPLERPHRRDIIVFRWPIDLHTHFIKRVVGVPGDTVSMRDGALIVNGVTQIEPYALHNDADGDPADDEMRWQGRYELHGLAAAPEERPSRNNWGPLVVPQKSYFVLGDNRDNSSDSRYWGFVPESLLEGRPIVVSFSYVLDSAERFPFLTRVRWHRIGERVE
jgi:signal peptidase I